MGYDNLALQGSGTLPLGASLAITGLIFLATVVLLVSALGLWPDVKARLSGLRGTSGHRRRPRTPTAEGHSR